MRILLAGAAVALLSTVAATPAFAQYGGSPQQQVDGAPTPRAEAPSQDDEDDQAVAPDDQDDQAYSAQPDDAYGKPGADQGDDYATGGDDNADVDQDADVDADQGDAGNEVDRGDADTDADQGDVDNDADQGDVDEDQGQAEPGDGGVAGGGYAQTQTQTWQGEDGRTYCRRSDGTTGAVVGGGAGALVGRGIDGGRHRAGGTIIGAIAGAVIGSAVEQSANRQRCS